MRAEALKSISIANFVSSILSLAYAALNIALIYINYSNAKAVNSGNELVVSERVFHLLEFWGTFGFCLVQLFALRQLPRSFDATMDNARQIKSVLFINVIATFVPALLVTVNMQHFEVISHELEYCSALSMSFLDTVLLWSLLYPRSEAEDLRKDQEQQRRQQNNVNDDRGQYSATAFYSSIIGIGVCAIQLGIYNGFGTTPDGHKVGEVLAHFCEFSFEVFSSLTLVWFALNNMHIADQELVRILFGDHEDCDVCATHVVQEGDVPASLV